MEGAWGSLHRATPPSKLAEAAGLALRLEKSDNVVLADGADDVADHGALRLEELNAHLGDAAAGAGAAEALDDAGEFNFFLYKHVWARRRLHNDACHRVSARPAAATRQSCLPGGWMDGWVGL